MLPKRFWHEMTTEDFESAGTEDWIAVLPVAAIEQHGPHLPLSTDTALAEGQIQRVIELAPNELPMTFLPVQTIGKSDEHVDYSGTLTLSWDTITKCWIEIGESVARAGIRKLVIINSHGGNVPVIDIVSRELRIKHNMFVLGTNWLRFGQPEGLFPEDELIYGIHGGDIETSLMLALRPDLVRMDLAQDFASEQQKFLKEFKHLRGHGKAQFGWKAQDLNPDGTLGNASAATAEKGHKSLDHAAKAFIELVEDVQSYDLNRLKRR
ncbi:creatininase family protein [Roseibium sp.]|uniref:creatininase family protein n=1 Tax=Roseibium sp. TaxID=1936156 RepID=UPI003D135E85